MEMSSESAICYKCGKKYGRRKGFFPVSYSLMSKGVGYLPVCKDCIDDMYNAYLSQCHDARMAVRQMCRKLDLFWSESVYEVVQRKTTPSSMMTQYIAKINTVTYAGKSYDETLSGEGTLWLFSAKSDSPGVNENIKDTEEPDAKTRISEEELVIPDELVKAWGEGYSPDMYRELEQRWQYWTSQLPADYALDMGTEVLLRQICAIDVDIRRERIAGRPVDKLTSVLNSLIGSANLKPAQQRSNADAVLENTPFGVWTKIWEDKRPIPETDPELKDVDGIVKYVLTWVYGHLAKMLGIKNAPRRLYDKAVERLRVDHPEYSGEDDDDLLYDVFSGEADGDIPSTSSLPDNETPNEEDE